MVSESLANIDEGTFAEEDANENAVTRTCSTENKRDNHVRYWRYHAYFV